MARARATIRGRVQGVSYRMNAFREAVRRSLSGWVKNLPDGSVLLEAQGERSAVEGLIAWCRHGPAGARVTAVELEWAQDLPAETSFEIRH